MIDIPPGSSPSTSASVAATPPSVDTVKAAVQAKLEAVVQQVQARHPEGQPDKKSWDILLRLNPQASGTPVRTDSLTPELLRNLQAGQPVLLQTRANLMLPVDARLQVSVSVANGVQIQTVQPPPLPPQALTHLRQFIHQQQPLAPLLTNLLQLLLQGQQTQLQTLPPRVQAAIAQMIAALPNPQAAREQLKTWVENSGLQQEAKLAQLARQTASTTMPNADAAARQTTNLASGTPALQQVRQQVQAWVQRLKTDGEGRMTAAANSPATASASPLAAALEQDIKHQLQRLERQLQNAGATPASTPPSTDTTAAKTVPTAIPTPPAAKPDAIAANAGVVNATTVDNSGTPKPTPSPELARSSEALAREATQVASAPIKSPLAIQRYQASGATSATAKAVADATTPDLIPPLPGQVVVQAQPRARASLKPDDMADAIVKTLLAQVRGALARVTLHQLSSHSARQDSATPTSLSFEIPFLHHSQIDVFQFRIDEETPHGEEHKEKNQAKRWVVQMGFDIEGLGPMFCQLSLTGKALAVQFWAAWEQTLTSTKAHFGFLEQALQDMGIRVEKIQAQLGMPEVDRTGLRNQLVDIKT
jgi:hypothetical protein